MTADRMMYPRSWHIVSSMSLTVFLASCTVDSPTNEFAHSSAGALGATTALTSTQSLYSERGGIGIAPPAGQGLQLGTPLTALPLSPEDQEKFIRRALMITDLAILNDASTETTAPRFTLRAVLQQLATQAGAVGQTPVQMYRQWWDVLNASPGLSNQPGVPHCSDRGGTLNGFPYSCRTVEGSQAAASTNVTVDSYFPIGLVNRFDLAPTDGANCGEYRILFAKNGTVPTDRSLAIFEASLPNPNPALGIEGCLPIQKFWAGLRTDNVVTSRAVKLRNFYFNGLDGLPTTKVISIDNFGRTGGEGQVRINILREGGNPAVAWSLREFKLQSLPSCTTTPCSLTFVPVTDKVNPAPILFGPAVGAQATLIQQFQNDFLAQVPSLAINDINRFTFNMADRYNIGQSNSEIDNYGRSPSPVATAAFKSAIAAAIPLGAGLTADDI